MAGGRDIRPQPSPPSIACSRRRWVLSAFARAYRVWAGDPEEMAVVRRSASVPIIARPNRSTTLADAKQPSPARRRLRCLLDLHRQGRRHRPGREPSPISPLAQGIAVYHRIEPGSWASDRRHHDPPGASPHRGITPDSYPCDTSSGPFFYEDDILKVPLSLGGRPAPGRPIGRVLAWSSTRRRSRKYPRPVDGPGVCLGADVGLQCPATSKQGTEHRESAMNHINLDTQVEGRQRSSSSPCPRTRKGRLIEVNGTCGIARLVPIRAEHNAGSDAESTWTHGEECPPVLPHRPKEIEGTLNAQRKPANCRPCKRQMLEHVPAGGAAPSGSHEASARRASHQGRGGAERMNPFTYPSAPHVRRHGPQALSTPDGLPR